MRTSPRILALFGGFVFHFNNKKENQRTTVVSLYRSPLQLIQEKKRRGEETQLKVSEVNHWFSEKKKTEADRVHTDDEENKQNKSKEVGEG